MADGLLYKLRSGKPPKFLYFLSSYARELVPNVFYRSRLKKALAKVERYPQKEYILERVEYYNKLNRLKPLPEGGYTERYQSYFVHLGAIKDYRISFYHKVYYFDFMQYARWFDPSFRWGYAAGDIYFTPKIPSIVKSRLLTRDNENSVVMKLGKLRHFIYVKDPLSFEKKKNMAIFRGKIRLSRDRRRFMEMFFGHPMFDCGLVGYDDPPQWITPKKTIREHLDYKFIMTLEGNDVASNLKWVMSSNSIAVMPRPTCETWFMEGKLIPDHHYIEVKSDFSDLEEKLNYYIEHPKEAQRIIDNAHRYVAQFRDKKRENLISLLVLDKYFRMTGQKSDQGK
ncbi:MAG: lipopolysaccharide biosynthesis protein [Alistipes sp.]|nr:lipopolysaccharide biosynthesis protein [Alistipes sp.]